MAHIQIKLSKDELERLRDVAKINGFILDRGIKIGEGSVRQMLLALADHHYKIVPVCSVEGCDNQVAVKSKANVCWNHLHDILDESKWRKKWGDD